MEDQRPAAGDLTAEAATATATDTEAVGEAVGPTDEPENRRFRLGRWNTGRFTTRRLTIAAAIAAALFVGSAAFAGAAVQPYLADRAAVAVKTKVTKTATRAITTSSTEVVGAAVESLDDRNAVVIVYTNTTSSSPLTQNVPSLKYLSYRMFMTHQAGRWLVTRMATITSLDLTPHS